MPEDVEIEERITRPIGHTCAKAHCKAQARGFVQDCDGVAIWTCYAHRNEYAGGE